jgi:glycosyltransferase involved in cell wall biosynthesis
MFFFSRDKRTHDLFRASWHKAADKNGVNIEVFYRGFGFLDLLSSVFSFALASGRSRFVFGTSEILLYSIISGKNDVWIFTGLGRLLLKNGVISTGVRKMLGFLYRGQLVVVLNQFDGEYISRFIKCDPIVVNGEGYVFNKSVAESSSQAIDGVIKFAYVGRLIKSKGVDKLLSDFLEYSDALWQLILVGDRDFNNSDSISEHQICKYSELSNGRIKFIGFKPNVANLLRETSVYISMSSREGLPFGVLDAINAGLFVILSAVPGHLSFAGLPGVIIIQNDLKEVLDQIKCGEINIHHFDRKKRLQMCINRFGFDVVVNDISCKVFNNLNKQ